MSIGDRLRSIVREVRQELVDGRQQLRAQHDRGLEGVRVCARYTSLVDTAIGRIYDAYLAELPQADQAGAVAGGGDSFRPLTVSTCDSRSVPGSYTFHGPATRSA